MKSLGDSLLEDILKGPKHKDYCDSFENYFEMVNGLTLGTSELFEEIFPHFNFPTRDYYGSLIRAKLLNHELLLVMGISYDVSLNSDPSFIDWAIKGSYELVNEVDTHKCFVDFKVKSIGNETTTVKLPVCLKLYKIKPSANTQTFCKIDEINIKHYSPYEMVIAPVNFPEDWIKIKFKLTELKKFHRNYLKDNRMIEKTGKLPELVNLIDEIKSYGKNRL